MSEGVIDYLREQFARLHARLDDVVRWQAEAGKRLSAIERHVAGMRRDAAMDAEDVVHTREGVAALAERVARIERRLDIAP